MKSLNNTTTEVNNLHLKIQNLGLSDQKGDFFARVQKDTDWKVEKTKTAIIDFKIQYLLCSLRHSCSQEPHQLDNAKPKCMHNGSINVMGIAAYNGRQISPDACNGATAKDRGLGVPARAFFWISATNKSLVNHKQHY